MLEDVQTLIAVSAFFVDEVSVEFFGDPVGAEDVLEVTAFEEYRGLGIAVGQGLQGKIPFKSRGIGALPLGLDGFLVPGRIEVGLADQGDGSHLRAWIGLGGGSFGKGHALQGGRIEQVLGQWAISQLDQCRFSSEDAVIGNGIDGGESHLPPFLGGLSFVLQ